MREGGKRVNGEAGVCDRKNFKIFPNSVEMQRGLGHGGVGNAFFWRAQMFQNAAQTIFRLFVLPFRGA